MLAQLLRSLADEERVALVSHLSPARTTDLLPLLDLDTRAALIDSLPATHRRETETLLAYPPTASAQK